MTDANALQLAADRVLYGVAFTDADGNRLDPMLSDHPDVVAWRDNLPAVSAEARWWNADLRPRYRVFRASYIWGRGHIEWSCVGGRQWRPCDLTFAARVWGAS